MTHDRDEQVIAFIDGQLEPDERAAFEERLAIDPALRDRVASHRWMTRQIKAALPVPPLPLEQDHQWVARLGLPAIEAPRLAFFRRSAGAAAKPLMLAAVAASLLLGLFIGRTQFSASNGLVVFEQGKAMAAGQLADSLSSQLSGQQGDVHIAMSYRTTSEVCRTFSARGGVSGLGCRDGNRWLLKKFHVDASQDRPATELRLAAGDVHPSVMAEVDREISGEPLAPREEAKLIGSDWH